MAEEVKQPKESELKEADKTSAPTATVDAEPNDPPVRTNRPDVPILDSLAVGAGATEARVLDHEVEGIEVDENGLDADGRFQGEPKKASSSSSSSSSSEKKSE